MELLSAATLYLSRYAQAQESFCILREIWSGFL